MGPDYMNLIIDDNREADKKILDEQRKKELLLDPFMKNYLAQQSGIMENASSVSAEIAI